MSLGVLAVGAMIVSPMDGSPHSGWLQSVAMGHVWTAPWELQDFGGNAASSAHRNGSALRQPRSPKSGLGTQSTLVSEVWYPNPHIQRRLRNYNSEQPGYREHYLATFPYCGGRSLDDPSDRGAKNTCVWRLHRRSVSNKAHGHRSLSLF